MNRLIEIKNLHVNVDGKEILKGINLNIGKGEVHALMGPNGSGKSTLSYAIAGHPRYKITKGDILYHYQSIKDMPVEARARRGIFLAFQNPVEIEGVNFFKFLYQIAKIKNPQLRILEFREKIKTIEKTIGCRTLLKRNLHSGFSGGEKKRSEILQFMITKPKFALFDEIDSGLDVDSLKIVSNAINAMRNEEFSALLITHFPRILKTVKPDFVHIIKDGKIIKSGKENLAASIESAGYTKYD